MAGDILTTADLFAPEQEQEKKATILSTADLFGPDKQPETPKESFLKKTGKNLLGGIISAPKAVIGGIGSAVKAIGGGQPIIPKNIDEYMRELQRGGVEAGKGMAEWTYKTPANLVKNPVEQISQDPLGTLAWLGMAGGAGVKGVKKIMPKAIPAIAKSGDLGFLPKGSELFDKILKPAAREKIYQDLIDKFHSIKTATARAKALGADLKSWENPALRAKSYLGEGARAQAVIEFGTAIEDATTQTYKITGEGLKPILSDYEKASPAKTWDIKRQDLNDYLVSQRYIQDLQRPVREGMKENIAKPEQIAEAQTKLDALNQKYGGNLSHLQDASSRIYDFEKRLLYDYGVESGRYSKAEADRIVAQNPNYIPFDRIFEEVKPTGGVPGKTLETARGPVKGIKGSKKGVYDVVGNLYKYTFKMLDAADQNMIKLSVSKLGEFLPEEIKQTKPSMMPIRLTAEEAGGVPKTIFRPSAFKPTGKVVEYFDDGVKKYMEVTPNLHDAMAGMTRGSAGFVERMMGKVARTLRYGATATPEFILRNPIRDQFDAFLQTKVGFRPFINVPKSIAEIAGRGDIYQEYLRSGAAWSGFTELNRASLERMYRTLTRPHKLLELKKLNIISDAEAISEVMEKATRVAVYKAAKEKGLSPLEAAYQARESTVDFAQSGLKLQNFTSTVAFLKAGVNAFDKTVRTFKNDPIGVAAKGLATITVPSIVEYYLNRDNKDYKELPLYDRYLFWHIPVGNRFVRIPRPFIYGQVFGTIPQQFIEYMDKKDPKALEGVIAQLGQSASPWSGPLASGALPTMLKPLIENATNWSFFRQRHIVPESKEMLPAEEQYSPYTSETAKALSAVARKIPGLSEVAGAPAKMENLIRGYTGGAGGYGLQAGDLIIRAGAKVAGEEIPEARPKDISDYPLLRGFVSRPVYSMEAQSLQDFYTNKKNVDSWQKAFNVAIKRGDTKKAIEIRQTHPEIANAKDMNAMAKDFSSVRATMDKISSSKLLTDAEKRKRLEALARQLIEKAKIMNKRVG